MAVEEHTITLDGSPAFYRLAPAGADATPLYVHGVPTSSDDWSALLERTGGVAPDLIGFGRSGKGGQIDYSPQGLADYLGSLAGHLDLERIDLVAHGWGAVAAVLMAASQLSRVRRIALLCPPPALPGHRWRALERAWRTPGVGELVMGSTTRALLAATLRRASAQPSAWPPERTREVWRQFDQGTQRAILRMVRSWDAESAEGLARALRGLAMPALVAWGDCDPCSGPELAEAYASHLPHSRVERIREAGHWPWLDNSAAVDLLAGWLAG